MIMRLMWLASVLVTLSAAIPVVTNKATSVSYQGTSAEGVDQFQGIFFAEDTSGANRFAPPKPFRPPHGTVIRATSPGAACPQATPAIVPFMSEVSNQSENCLHLRIARPADLLEHHQPLPVMVYVYGGECGPNRGLLGDVDEAVADGYRQVGRSWGRRKMSCLIRSVWSSNRWRTVSR